MAKRGRPPLSAHEPSTRMTLALPSGLYDRAYEAAQQARVTVPEMVRRILSREFRNTKSTPLDNSLTL
jgi:hypothetical protein